MYTIVSPESTMPLHLDWTPLLSLTKQSFREGTYDDVICGGCPKSLLDGDTYYTYHRGNMIHSIDFCADCFRRREYRDFLQTEDINGLHASKEEKPLCRPCHFCRKPLGEGCKWKIIKMRKSDDNSDKYWDTDVCTDCYSKKGGDDGVIRELFLEVNEMCVRFSDYPVSIDVSNPPVDSRSRRRFGQLPKCLRERIDNGSIAAWMKCIHKLVCTPCPSKMGSVKEWVFVNDFEEDDNENVNMRVGFIVNYLTHQIAIIVSDDHNRVGVNITHDNPNDFLRDHRRWQEDVDAVKTQKNFGPWFRDQLNMESYFANYQKMYDQ